MSYVQKNLKNVTVSIVGILAAATIAFWQFYLFVTFKGDGGSSHLWWAVAMAILAFGAAFLVFSVFVRHDVEDELHITSAGPRRRS